MSEQLIPDDGYADGGVPYTDEELEWIEQAELCWCGHPASEHSASGICTHYPGEAPIYLAYAAQ